MFRSDKKVKQNLGFIGGAFRFMSREIIGMSTHGILCSILVIISIKRQTDWREYNVKLPR